MSRKLCMIAVLILAVLSPGNLLAQQDHQLAEKLESIRQRMEKGQGLFLAGKQEAAAKVFEDGYKAHPYSAFLFNAGVCYQKLNDYDRALAKFKRYLEVDPNAPDAEKVRERIAALEGARSKALPDQPAPVTPEGETPPAPPPALEAIDDASAMKSLVVIETEPGGAPLTLHARVQDGAAPFVVGGENPGWKQVATAESPVNLTLDVGRYHVVVEKFRDFNVSQADIDVSPGHVHHFKANLSQGAFMAFLRVSSNVLGSYVFVDDPERKRLPWGIAPHGELVGAGKHSIVVEAPGFEPLTTEVELAHGEQKDVQVNLTRVGYGLLRFQSNAPEIEVSVGDKPVGVWRAGTVPLEVKLDSGKHKLTVTSSGRKTFEGEVDVPRGQARPVQVKMIPKYPRGAAWTQTAIAAVCIGAGIYLGLESNSLFDELERDREAGVLEQDDSRVSRGRWFAVGANAGFVLGGVAAGLATYNFIKDPLPESSVKPEKPVEFDDPRKQRPVARAPARAWPSGLARRVEGREREARDPEARGSAFFRLTPRVAENAGALVLEGRF